MDKGHPPESQDYQVLKTESELCLHYTTELYSGLFFSFVSFRKLNIYRTLTVARGS